ncbi:MAG TPA: pentapeptide repeat-containing protein [Chthoniobacterales bacterium]|nr:pentapeptide repeat-containing protein [Chthoniobacterales bacterium]
MRQNAMFQPKSVKTFPVKSAAPAAAGTLRRLAQRIADDFHELVRLSQNHLNPSAWKKVLNYAEKALAICGVIAAAIFAWEQFLEGRAQNTKSLVESSFASAREQLAASSPAIRASAVRSIFELSFTETIAEPSLLKGFPGQYTWNWMLRRRDFPMLERGKSLLKEFALSDPIPNDAPENIVSSALLSVGLDISERESRMRGVSFVSNPGLLLHRANLPRARANNRTLDDIDFGAADFSQANLSGCRLKRVGFTAARLQKAVFNGSILLEANLLRATASGCDFSFANLEDAVLMQGELSHAKFTRATLSGADFSLAMLREATFRGSVAVRAKFKEANLQRADFSQADVAAADFSGADLDEVDFQFTTGLETAKWEGARHADTAKFPAGFRPKL